ncbi:hypothetical protein [Mycolicibacterium fortuitum]|uniref:Uncharacterized protein n=1 Tax=Mycolicibacterium fortuitum TaxID=1766 RepID=A0AAE4VEY3_MYCFO|nr:hypothetical protein [Mycolicibacterium fortuitum]MDV7193307.1 hypothetical protein [Mycolicibacterium fortuitum]MDV7206012.1 hypothetical protein [Mycolicibacterium fortuitum]MDV7227425.1 hypothetical protein [Mycolicibacterium fortuitum]MDV7259878.1 hypothetical protein [Mycolicibacterium fortuitum]MDV7286027.1 hypothetical protein [Mycolicibacterium fortuitum]
MSARDPLVEFVERGRAAEAAAGQAVSEAWQSQDWVGSVQAGTAVEVRTATGEWIEAVADSAIEGTHDGRRRIHDFPVIWIRINDARLPWPVPDVRRPERDRRTGELAAEIAERSAELNERLT